MPFHAFFEEIFFFLHTRDNHVIIMAVFIGLHLFTITLRIALTLSYRTHLMRVDADTRPEKALKTLEDAKNLRSRLLKRVIQEYVLAAEKNAARVPLATIVDRYINALSVVGLPAAGMGRLVLQLENALLLVGLVLALLFPPFVMVYGILAIAGFVLTKFTAAFFDYEGVRQSLANGLHLYIEREIGQFFAGHTAAALLQFKEATAEALDRQSLLLHNAIEKLSAESTAVLTPLAALTTLPKAVEAVAQSNDRYAVHHQEFLAQSKIIEEIQKALGASLASYETTLQSLCQSMGESLGTFVQLHAQTASHAFNESLQTQLNRILSSHQETLSAVTGLLKQQSEQEENILTQLRMLHERLG